MFISSKVVKDAFNIYFPCYEKYGLVNNPD